MLHKLVQARAKVLGLSGQVAPKMSTLIDISAGAAAFFVLFGGFVWLISTDASYRCFCWMLDHPVVTLFGFSVVVGTMVVAGKPA